MFSICLRVCVLCFAPLQDAHDIVKADIDKQVAFRTHKTTEMSAVGFAFLFFSFQALRKLSLSFHQRVVLWMFAFVKWICFHFPHQSIRLTDNANRKNVYCQSTFPTSVNKNYFWYVLRRKPDCTRRARSWSNKSRRRRTRKRPRKNAPSNSGSCWLSFETDLFSLVIIKLEWILKRFNKSGLGIVFRFPSLLPVAA